MAPRFKDVEHLLRLGAIFAFGLVFFLVARAIFTPEDFGEYGFYRGSALTDAEAHEPVHAGQDACVACHTDIGEKKASSPHAGVHCEGCHGPLAEHARGEAEELPPKPETVALCTGCHAELSGRPADFPQVEPEEHSMGNPCGGCHDVHDPDFE